MKIHSIVENKRRDVIITVFKNTEESEDWPPVDAIGVMTWIQSKLDLIPPEYLKSACVDLSGWSNPDEIGGVIHIYYDRLETDKERDLRIIEEREHEAAASTFVYPDN